MRRLAIVGPLLAGLLLIGAPAQAAQHPAPTGPTTDKASVSPVSAAADTAPGARPEAISIGVVALFSGDDTDEDERKIRTDDRRRKADRLSWRADRGDAGVAGTTGFEDGIRHRIMAGLLELDPSAR